MNVLVTGGAGYIGSHAVKRLTGGGHKVVTVDNLFRGHREAAPANVAFQQLDLRQTDALTGLLTNHRIDCVMHFAALAYVGESVPKPLLYYDNNTAGTISLLRAMDAAGVRKLVFSSTCATYGEPTPDKMPLTEETPQSPINPYGWSKLFVERILKDYAAATKDFTYAALRYFNVAGCAADGTLGEDHEPETHLIPVLLNAALGKVPKVTIFGTDYPTPDGTCIRDYVHVEDLADAHAVVMEKTSSRRAADLQPGHRQGLHRAAGDRRRQARHGRGFQSRDRPAPPGRPADALRQRRQDQARAELAGEVHRHRQNRRDGVAVV